MCARPEKMETPTLSASIRVAELAKEDRQAAMAVAGIRGLAFAGPSALSSEEFIGAYRPPPESIAFVALFAP